MVRVLVLLALLLVPRAARADLTVIYAPASRPPPRVALSVCAPASPDEPRCDEGSPRVLGAIGAAAPPPSAAEIPHETEGRLVERAAPDEAPLSRTRADDAPATLPPAVSSATVAPATPPPAVSSATVAPATSPASTDLDPRVARGAEAVEPELGGGRRTARRPARLAAPIPRGGPPEAQPVPEAPARPSPVAPLPRGADAFDGACAARPDVSLRREGAGADEHVRLRLTDCEGRPDDAATTALSVLARPATLETAPSAHELDEHTADATWVAAGVRRLHPGLVERVRALADAFPGHVVTIVPAHGGLGGTSRHALGLALDVRVEGASLSSVDAFARRLDRTGVGRYDELGVLHLDVRSHAAHWTDAEGADGGVALDATRPRGAWIRTAAWRDPSAAPAPAIARTTPSPVTPTNESPPRAAEEPSRVVVAGASPVSPALRPAVAGAATARASDAVTASLDADDPVDPDDIADEILRGLEGLSLEAPGH